MAEREDLDSVLLGLATDQPGLRHIDPADHPCGIVKRLTAGGAIYRLRVDERGPPRPGHPLDVPAPGQQPFGPFPGVLPAVPRRGEGRVRPGRAGVRLRGVRRLELARSPRGTALRPD